MTLRGRGILDTSIVISLFRYFCRWYRSLEQRISCIYHNSQTHSLIGGFWEKTKICFRYSFLGRITEIKPTNPAVLDNSQITQYLVNFYKRWKDKIIQYSETSLATKLAKDTKEELYSLPVRIISIIIVGAIIVNVALSVVLQRQIGLWVWLIRGLFLFVGAVGISCELDWPTIKASSLFLKKCEYPRDVQKD